MAKRTYVVSGKHLSVIQLVNGLYCKQQVVNKKRSWVPLEVQPCTDAVVVVSSFYTTLKDDSSYRKEVSWLSVQPNIAVYEYQGRPPLINQLHGLTQNGKQEYVRTRPVVIERMRKELVDNHRQPRAAYEKMATVDVSTDRPRDHKQVRNQAQAVAEKVPGRGANVADQVMDLMKDVHGHPFIKDIIIRSGTLPVIVAYTAEHVQDLRRFCSTSTPPTLRTVVGVDRTFNLGP